MAISAGKKKAAAAKKKALATRGKGSSALAVANPYGDMGGSGFDQQTQDDMAMPFLSVLQKGSPQLDKKSDGHVKGAEEGDLFNTITEELYKSVIFQPCDTDHVFVEWVPRDQGGGFVAVHELGSDVVAAAKASSEEFGKYNHNGNDLVETYYMYGFLLNKVEDVMPEGAIIIAFTSTKIKQYKKINTAMRTMKGNPPIFAFRLKVETTYETRQQGNSYNLSLSPAIGSNVRECLIDPELDGKPHPLLVGGVALQKAVRGGVAKIDHSQQKAGAGQAEDGEDDVM